MKVTLKTLHEDYLAALGRRDVAFADETTTLPELWFALCSVCFFGRIYEIGSEHGLPAAALYKLANGSAEHHKTQ